MPIPDYQGLMLAVLRHGAAGETGVMQVEEKIADELGLSAEEREQLLPSGKQRILHNRIHWAKFYLQKAGLLEAPKRGRFVVSAVGLDLLKTNPPSVNLDTLRRYPSLLDSMRAPR
ncbi:winged helix-turn-helix domain-containing protein [Mesorhizobium sp.]|uniref:winged helix-turn-helix domain-containing protein n=1 Tax=Mesorhizobium sp. TaxID=1871066 RepID=UPI0025FE33DC|nr:winged helix-turn-helix domain-containing protein [Mesorhizobium sp.]